MEFPFIPGLINAILLGWVGWETLLFIIVAINVENPTYSDQALFSVGIEFIISKWGLTDYASTRNTNFCMASL